MAPQRWRRFDEDQTREGVGSRKLRVQNGFQQVVQQEAERQEAERGGRTGTHDTRTEDLLFWPLAGARLVLDTWLSLLGEPRELPAQSEAALSWATPHTIALELTTMRLRDFSTQAKGRSQEPPPREPPNTRIRRDRGRKVRRVSRARPLAKKLQHFAAYPPALGSPG